MNQVYEVRKNHSASDSDGWQNWVESNRVTLHASLIGAEAKMQELLAKDLEELEIWDALNPDELSPRYLEEVKANLRTFGVGDNAKDEAIHPIYFIEPVELLD